MGITKYRNLDLETLDYTNDGEIERFKIYVADSPAGIQKLAEAEKIEVTPQLREQLRQLGQGKLGLEQLITLGRTLAQLLFPTPRAHLFLAHSLARLEDQEGLRIRIRLCTYALADLPWEYAYIPGNDPLSAQAGPEGFLALNRRFSIVRSLTQGPISREREDLGAKGMSILSASPQSPRALDRRLEIERQHITETVQEAWGIRPKLYSDITESGLEEALGYTTHVVHFVGHGYFTGDPEADYGSQPEQAWVVLQDEHQRPVSFSAKQFAIRQVDCGVRLAVLDAYAAGQPDCMNPWLGVAPALIQCGISTVVGMQRPTNEHNAGAFYRRFYRTLIKKRPIDAAVVDGRLAIFNRSDDNSHDWGAPVLYLRTNSDSRVAQRHSLPAGVDIPGRTASHPSSRMRTHVDKHSLLDVLNQAFSIEELEALCIYVEQYLKDEDIVLDVNLDIVPGRSKSAKLVNLIKYLDREGHLAYLIKAVRSAQPGLI